jgi:prepilin-type N-terminal cleavage/methylation domain-containing protein
MKKTAFTLIELLVVIVIIGVLATISVAQFNEYQEKARQAKSIAFAAQAEKKLLADAVTQTLGSFIEYDFEGNNGEIIDSSGNGNHQSFTPTADLTFSDDTPIGLGQSLELKVSNIKINYNSKFVPTTKLTMSFFVKPVSPTGAQNFLYFANGGGLTIGGGDFQFLAAGAWNSSFNTNVQSNKWYHILATYDGDQASLYMDGDLVKTEDVGDDFNFSDATNQFRIGPPEPSFVSDFHILVDRIKIFPIAYDPS